MSEKKENKIWTDCGFFEVYEEAQNKIKELDGEYELYKIRKVREKGKKGWYKVKAWKTPVKKKRKKKGK